MRPSSVSFSKTKLRDESVVNGDTTSGVRLSEGKSCAGVESLEVKFCGLKKAISSL